MCPCYDYDQGNTLTLEWGPLPHPPWNATLFINDSIALKHGGDETKIIVGKREKSCHKYICKWELTSYNIKQDAIYIADALREMHSILRSKYSQRDSKDVHV